MRRRVGGQGSGVGQLPKGPVAEEKLVDDSEPVDVAERGIGAGAIFDEHESDDTDSIFTESMAIRGDRIRSSAE